MTEPELERFFDRAALTLSALLRGTVWETVASHTANDPGGARAAGRLGYLHTAQGVLAGVDRPHLAELLVAGLSARMLDRLIQQLDS